MGWVIDHIGPILTFAGVIWTALIGVSNKKQIQEIHIILNSRLDALLKTTGAQGRLEGAATERARADKVNDDLTK